MSAPDEILGLVKRFEDNKKHYRSSGYNETQTRVELINPMFIALGWDVNNEQGYAEAYKDVIHEDAIRVGGATEAPDYCFRIGGTRKFFLEAKRPGINLNTDPLPAFQLRRYAWSARLSLSVLTDFEEFAVYDSRVKTQASLPNSEAGLKLLFGLFASGQVAMRRIGGWRDLPAHIAAKRVEMGLRKPLDKVASVEVRWLCLGRIKLNFPPQRGHNRRYV